MIRITAKTVATRPFSLAADGRPYVSAIGDCQPISVLRNGWLYRDFRSR